jgi:uncharacterized protein YciI
VAGCRTKLFSSRRPRFWFLGVERFSARLAGGLEDGDMKFFALFYHVVDDFVSRRTPYREEHLRLAREAHRRGELLLAGAFTEPADRALLVFRVAERSVVEEFARSDPYVTSGLVTRWEIRPWAVVIGESSCDARPKAV